jgi:hypothetical protein
MRKRRNNYPPPIPTGTQKILDWDITKATNLLRSGSWNDFSSYLLGKKGWSPDTIENAWIATRGEIKNE